MTFGESLKAARGDRPATEVARAALGADAPLEKIRDFANYLSRIERDRVPNVGLQQLRLIAKGLGLASMRDFFALIEHQQNSSLQTPTDEVHNPAFASPSSEATDGDETHDESILDRHAERFASTLVAFVKRELAARNKSTASPRPQKQARRPRDRRRRRSSD